MRPLAGGLAWQWTPEVGAARIYHRDERTAHACQRRTYPALTGRFDHHDVGQLVEDNRSVFYIATSLTTAICEAVAAAAKVVPGGGRRIVSVCPNRRFAYLSPTAPVLLQDLLAPSEVALGCPTDLGDGDYSVADTQAWGRAFHADRPADPEVGGVRYWSARHRDAAGARAGVNLVVWEQAAALRLIDEDKALLDSDLLLTTLDRAGVALEIVTSEDCLECRRAARS